MAISIFPSTAAEFVSNNFVVDMNDSTNNTADTGGVKQAGPYSMSFSSGDTSFDVYLIDDEGNSVGYSNSTSINASGLFSTVVILGVAQDEVISFTYQGSVNNADGEGDEPGAGAYLESISPTDLPSIDDTATVTGGNFASDVEITFESGATVLSAKNIVVNSSTELLVTRPDGLIEDNAPYDLKAVNPGVTPPTGSDAHILVDGVTAGSDPTWVTTSPLNQAVPNEAFSQTLEATDVEGTVVDYSVTAGTITPGLTLNASTGVLSGTPTTVGNFTFTVTATDDGENETGKQFEHSVNFALGGTVVDDGSFRYHIYTATDDFEVLASSLDVDYLIVAGGSGGGRNNNTNSVTSGGGGGGAGGLLNGTATLTPGIITATVGAGGVGTGTDSEFLGIGTAVAGGKGNFGGNIGGEDGGSGGGGHGFRNEPGPGTQGGSGIAGQGFDGGNALTNGQDPGGGGGGAGAVGQDAPGGNVKAGDGGAGALFSDFSTASGLDFDGGFFAGGGGGGFGSSAFGKAFGGIGGGGDGSTQQQGNAGEPNSGGGGGGCSGRKKNTGTNGGSGVIMLRYPL